MRIKIGNFAAALKPDQMNGNLQKGSITIFFDTAGKKEKSVFAQKRENVGIDFFQRKERKVQESE